MILRRLGLAALAVLLLAAAARTAAYADQVSEWRRKAFEKRAKLRWDLKRLYAQYPTPELQLVSTAPVAIAPGATAAVKVKGKVPPGSLVLFDCPELEVVSLKQTPRSVDAKVKAVAPLFSPPKDCRLAAFAPVSNASFSLPAVQVRAQYRWSLALGNGLRAEVSLVPGEAGRAPAWTSQWRDGGQDLGERSIRVDGPLDPNQPLRMLIGRTQEDNEAANQRWAADPMFAQANAVYGEKRRAMQGISRQCIAEAGGPARLDERKMRACEKQRGDELNRSFAAREQPFHLREGELTREHPSVCNVLELEPGGLGRVSGVARDCHGQGIGEVKVEGMLSAMP